LVKLGAKGVSHPACVRPHLECLALGKTSLERPESYRALFVDHVDYSEFLKEIRENTNKGLAIGHDRFNDEIEMQTGGRVTANKRGRPEGWRELKI